MSLKYVYRNPRPILAVELAGGAMLGNCYSGTTYRITSTRPLSTADIRAIREAGVIGHGQEFYIRGLLDAHDRLTPVLETVEWDSKVKATGMDEVPCVAEDYATGKPQPGPAINPYSGSPYEPIKQPYYVYVTEDRVDSSD